MLQIELVPDLDHCVETVAKREYAEITRQLLVGEGDANLQEKAELLGAFLRTADFRKLRQESERFLVEGKEVKFVIYVEDGTPKYDMRV